MNAAELGFSECSGLWRPNSQFEPEFLSHVWQKKGFQVRKHSEICRPERGNDRARTQNCVLRESEVAGPLGHQCVGGDTDLVLQCSLRRVAGRRAP